MQSRWIIALLGAATVFQVGVTAMAVTAWPCPLKSMLGVACPGCGLTRAIVLLVQGKWQAAVQIHAFAPVGLAIGILLMIGTLLPATLRHRAAERLATFEKRSGIVFWLILGALIYWICRLMLHI
jgi:hypothetical protein